MINRRRFVGASLGAGLASRSIIETTPKPSPRFPPAAQTRGTAREVSDYERAFADTLHIEFVGRPRSWSVIRDGFHPISPHRVLVLARHGDRCHGDPAGHWMYGHQATVQSVWTRLTRNPHVSRHVSKAKVGLIARLTYELTRYYAVPDYWEDWTLEMCLREDLGSTGIGRHVAAPHQWQASGYVQTENSPLDWWLWLLPEGTNCWQSLDELPVHVMFTQVYADPRLELPRYYIDVLCILQKALMSLMEMSPDIFVQLSKMGRENAARLVNRHVALALSNESQT